MMTSNWVPGRGLEIPPMESTQLPFRSMAGKSWKRRLLLILVGRPAELALPEMTVGAIPLCGERLFEAVLRGPRPCGWRCCLSPGDPGKLARNFRNPMDWRSS
jgi:hypothetical protein